MTSEPSLDAFKALRLAVQQIEQTEGAARTAAIAELKRIVLDRLADLESEFGAGSLTPDSSDVPQLRGLAGPSMPLSLADLQAIQEAMGNVPLHKLD